MIPALPNIGTLRGLAHRVQSQSTSQFFEVVEVLAHGSLGPEPLWLGLANRRREIDLYELGSSCHLHLTILHARLVIHEAHPFHHRGTETQRTLKPLQKPLTLPAPLENEAFSVALGESRLARKEFCEEGNQDGADHFRAQPTNLPDKRRPTL
jgi:hypothetical protein